VAGSCVYGDEPSGSINAGNFLCSLGYFSFSGSTLLHGVSLVGCPKVRGFHWILKLAKTVL
jgi:hypothetical protein